MPSSVKRAISRTYTVEKGDTLWRVAEKNCSDARQWQQIAQLNNLSAPYRIVIGQVLKLPSRSIERPKASRAFGTGIDKAHETMPNNGPSSGRDTQRPTRGATQARHSTQAVGIPSPGSNWPAAELCSPAFEFPMDHVFMQYVSPLGSMKVGFTGTLNVQRCAAAEGLTITTDGILEFTNQQKLLAANDMVAILCETKVAWNSTTGRPEFSGGLAVGVGDATVKVTIKLPKTLRYTLSLKRIETVRERIDAPRVNFTGQGEYWLECEPSDPHLVAVLVEEIVHWLKDAQGRWVVVLQPHVLVPLSLLTVAIATVTIAGRILAGFVEGISMAGATVMLGLIFVTPDLQKELDRLQGKQSLPGPI